MCLPFQHKWAVQTSEDVKTFESSVLQPDALPFKIVRVYQLRCEKCGDLKFKKVTL